MLSRRRLISVVVASALVLTGLSACRSTPGVAAYVGQAKYTDAYVDDVVSSYEADIAEAARKKAQSDTDQAVKAGQLKPEDAAKHVDEEVAKTTDSVRADFGNLRQTVVRFLVVRDAGTAYAKSHGITITPADKTALATQYNLPVDNTLLGLFAEYGAVMQALSGAAKSTAPSDADKHEAYDNLPTDQGALPPYNAIESAFTEQSMGTAVGLRNLMTTVLADARTKVSPRYAVLNEQIPLQVGQVNTFLTVPLATGSGAVSNQPPSAAPANPAA